ncbi:myelin basic protein isoform X2 [Nematolebias whitei]|uniref:myelin basic protein isoform X2 n=1 Tax=Nematolebias whitei TaxID=451745 RepID=UPI001898F20B|nr:myelin basic protein isoform X2 [Nematolebias whitei]
MASASSSAQAAFGLGRRKKNPGLLDQIGKFFGGDKKRKSKGSFRGALSPAPQKASVTSPRKRGGENAVVHFFRTIVSNAHSEPHRSNTHRPHTSEDSKCSGNVSPSRPKSRGHQKSSKKASAGDGKGTLTRIFKMGSRSASPAKR